MSAPCKKFWINGQTLAQKGALPSEKRFFIAKRRQGLSLLELILTLAVLSVLAVLVVSNARSLRGKAAAIRCMNNLKQIGAANLAYASDHRGQIAARNNIRDANGNPTPRNHWYRYIWRTYFGAANGDGTSQGDSGYCEAMICPADPTHGGGPDVSRSLQRSYNVNQSLATTGGSRTMKQVSHLSKTMYAGEIDWVKAGNSEYIIATSLNNLNAIPRTRHQEQANFVFLDGHVETIRIEEIYPGQSRSTIFDTVHP